jgi:hypothetical protein
MLWFKKTTTPPTPEMSPVATPKPAPQRRARPWARWSNKPHSGIPDVHRVPGEPPISRPAVWRGPDDGGGVETNPYTRQPIGRWMARR